MKIRSNILGNYLFLEKLISRSKIYKPITILLLTTITLLFITTNLYADYAPNQIIVKYKNGIAATRSIAINSSRKIMKQTSFPTYLIKNTFLLETSDNVTNSINMLKSDPDIEYAEPNYIVYPTKAPNDLDYRGASKYQFSAVHGINAENGWDIITDSSNILVAILDTGIDLDHEDLKNNIHPYGLNATIPNSEPGIGQGDAGTDIHGTHVSGIVGATGDNLKGNTGVAWRSNLVAIKVLTDDGGFTSDVIRGINYAIQVGAKVINASLGGDPNQLSKSEYDAVKQAVDSGIVFIAAAGNAKSNTDYNPEYPAALPIRGVISVGASDDRSAIWIGNNGGSSTGRTSVHLFAPGYRIWNTITPRVINGYLTSYASLTGTSMATPMVSGAVSLLLAKKPYLTPSNVEQLLINSVRKTTNIDNQSMADGILDLEKLLKFNTNSLYDAPSNFRISIIAGTNASVKLEWEIDPNAQIEIYAKSARDDEFTLLDRLRAGTTEYTDKPSVTTAISRYYRIRALKNNVYTPFVQINRGFTVSRANLTPEFLLLSTPNEIDDITDATLPHNAIADTTEFVNINELDPILNVNRLDFGTVNINYNAESKSVNIRNGGAIRFTINSIALTNTDFEIGRETTTMTCSVGIVLATDENCNIIVNFKPLQQEDYAAYLKITTDQDTTHNISITGKGIYISDETSNDSSDGFIGGCSIGSSSDDLFILLLLLLIIKSIAIFKRGFRA